MAKLIMHRNFEQPKSELKRAIEGAKPGDLIFVVGPTGVGKTTIRQAVMRDIVGNPAHWGAGRLPAIEVLALLSSNAYFSSFGLVESLLGELFAPDLHWLLDGDPGSPAVLQIISEVAESRKQWEALPRLKQSERKMWEQFREVARHRSMRVASIDQAAALCTNHANTSPADHILHLMSIAEKGRFNFLFSGVHQTAELWSTRPEIRRRSHIVWISPYSYDRQADRDPFLRLLLTLGNRYRFSKPGLLHDMAADIVAATAGIYGIIEKLLEDASAKSVKAGRVVITRSDIEDSVYADADLTKLWLDVCAFEHARKVGSTKERASAAAAKWKLPGPNEAKKPKASGAAKAEGVPSENGA